MSGRIRIVTVACPGPQDSIAMPSCRDAESPRHNASVARSAWRWRSAPDFFGSRFIARLPTRESRRALFRERRDALRVVFRVTELALEVALAVELLDERCRRPRIHGLAGAHEATRRRPGERAREAVDELGEADIVHATPDESPVL